MAKRTNVPATQFVTVVVEVAAAGGNIQDVADKLGSKTGAVATRMSQLRTKGVKLPKLARRPGGGGGRPLDIDALNEIISG